MGMNPNYRRWGVDQWRTRAPTVGHMIEQRWSVFAWCGTCGLQMTVRLDVVAQARGRAFSLWGGRSAACRRRHCHGRMLFYAEPGRADGPFWLE